MEPRDGRLRFLLDPVESVTTWLEPIRIRFESLSDRTQGQLMAAGGAAALAATYLLWSHGIGFLPDEGKPLSTEQVGLGALLSAWMLYGLMLIVFPPIPMPDPSEPMASMVLEERRRSLWIRRFIVAAAALVTSFLLFRGSP